jgi:hypothetical protein
MYLTKVSNTATTPSPIKAEEVRIKYIDATPPGIPKNEKMYVQPGGIRAGGDVHRMFEEDIRENCEMKGRYGNVKVRCLV